MPSRAVHCSLAWLRGLERCLSEDGTLSVNFADLKELKTSGIEPFSQSKSGSNRPTAFVTES